MMNVGFLGAGTMGREMVLNLLKAGHAVSVYNRTPEKLRPLTDAGATAAVTPAVAAAGRDIVISIVGDDPASRAVWLGPEGALAGALAANAILVESSTLSRAWILELEAEARRRGCRFLDCPVTGGPDGARAATLTLLVGGEETTLKAARPALSAYANQVYHFGPVGAGTAYKLVVNLMGTVQAVAVAEGLLIAERAGLDLTQVAEALSSGAVASPMVKYIVKRMIASDHADVYFSARWRHKDASYALKLAEEMGQAVPTSATATQAFQAALDQGLGDLNSSVVIDALR
ncbi:MAG: NAD(P)-dependent oxidoreductase [Alphaproteobacteria bacterium]|nr:NAD(P)-dependent oxidoreductase [Alphaproteobacteria bacterium]